jgi:hypothetical protein
MTLGFSLLRVVGAIDVGRRVGKIRFRLGSNLAKPRVLGDTIPKL